MDRKTLLAFVLIALVLILTPWYMELVTPGYSEAQTDALYQAEETITNKNPSPVRRRDEQQRVSPPSLSRKASSKNIVIKNNYYTAILNNMNGGSFVSFELNKYMRYDSTLVNLIDELNKNNLLLSFVSLDGEMVVLNQAWSIINLSLIHI